MSSISIEDVCDVPEGLASSEAAQLIGGDGVAIISPTTQVFDATRAAADRRRGHVRWQVLTTAFHSRLSRRALPLGDRTRTASRYPRSQPAEPT